MTFFTISLATAQAIASRSVSFAVATTVLAEVIVLTPKFAGSKEIVKSATPRYAYVVRGVERKRKEKTEEKRKRERRMPEIFFLWSMLKFYVVQ
jgi:hypothetical protein